MTPLHFANVDLSPSVYICHIESEQEERVEVKPTAWPLNDPKAMASIRRGLKQSSEGKASHLGSFSRYARK